MNPFTELTHAWIAADFHRCLTGRFGERGREAFLLAIRYYGGQRGRRMAQRAVRNGRRLDFPAYQEYCEWNCSEEVLALGLANRSEILSRAPDLVMKITACPWHAQFLKMGCTDAGRDYCAVLDASIARGFHPDLVYEVSCTLNDGPYCLHTLRGACYGPDESHPRIPGMQMGWDYHCAHLFRALSGTSGSVFGEAGTALAESVLAELSREWSAVAAERIRAFADVDFNLLPDCPAGGSGVI